MDSGFAQAYLQATLLVSLLSVWVLVGLFYYLNRYTKREYFTIWTAAWLSYALWLTLGLTWPAEDPTSLISMLKQCCVAISAAFMLWGTLRFLDIPVRQTLFGLFMFFLVAWTFVIPKVATSTLQIQLPVFILLGSGSAFAGVCFYRVRRRLPYVGAGMLALGFLLWGVYLAFFPVAQQYPDLHAIGYLVAAVLQLFIAVSMIVLVLEEVRYKTEKILAEVATMRSEKEQLEARVITGEEQLRRLYDQVRLTEGAQQAYDELRRTQQVVVQQERLRALGQMASGVAHDINNALSPVSAYTELLTQTLPALPANARRYLGHIRSAAEDVAHIVGRMREFYRQRSNAEQLEAIAVDRLITEVAELTRPRWRDDAQRQGISIEVVCKPTPGLPALLGDPCELREALINLVFNAVDALPSGGRIELRTFILPPSAGVEGSQEQIAIEVCDNGSGMDEQTRQHCLEPFFTTKAQRGTGLGLSMVYGMMRRHNGLIEIDSVPQRGTTLRLVFPVRPLPEPPAAPASTPAASGRSLRILCVDDEPKLRDLLADCLGTFGHRVAVAGGGREGLEMFRATMDGRDHYEVVITDLGMPDFDGHQVARGVKALKPAVPVIMMTGWGNSMNDDGEKSASVDAVLGKPPKLEELVATLQLLAP
ncbi:MAG: response regulator [Opitutaceae bacterium]|nr:response regulator [Opitutaceae bacterium]